jgi:isoquinoline 1-oxidoreductase subunit beta
MKRRQLLSYSGAAVAVSFLPACSVIPVIPKRPAPNASDAAGWIRYEQGHYTLFIPRAEMGQHVSVALAQIACDALGIEWAQLKLQLPSSQSIKRVRATVGSDSIKDFSEPLKAACENLRKQLQAQGIATRRSTQPPLVGRSPLNPSSLAIATGQALFASDVHLKGMLYGRVLRSPISPEIRSQMMTMNREAARKVSGFVSLIEDDLLRFANSLGVGIVASTPSALDRIEAALAIDWKVEPPTTDKPLRSLSERLKKGALRYELKSQTFRTQAAWSVDLSFSVPRAAHAAIEPRCAVAFYQNEGLRLWVGSQDLFYQQDVIAKKLGLSEERIEVQAMRMGGAFGGKTISTVELEAAVLSKHTQAPVKVQWTRAQEFSHAFHRPSSTHRLRATLKNGRIEQWWHAFLSSHILFTGAVVPAWMQPFTDFIGDDGVARGAMHPYEIEQQRIEFDLYRSDIHTGPWRGLGAAPNNWVIESVMDECARIAKIDPIQFRVQHTPNARLARSLVAVAKLSNWSQKAFSDTKYWRGRGVASGIYKGMSYAAVVADVQIERTTGVITVTQLWCVHDCGLCINPDGVKAQVEGNLVWCVGMALVEELPSKNAEVSARNFGESPLLRINQIPLMNIQLIDQGEPPTGAGETAMVAGVAAITNAIKDACGFRVTQLPIRFIDLNQLKAV